MSIKPQDLAALLTESGTRKAGSILSHTKRGKLFESLRKKLVLDNLSLEKAQKIWAKICDLINPIQEENIRSSKFTKKFGFKYF